MLALAASEAEPDDYPEPVFPQEPEPDYTPYEGPAPDEFLPEERLTPFIPLADNETVTAAKAA